MFKIILIFVSLALTSGCGAPYGGKTSKPKSDYDDMWGKQLPNDKAYERIEPDRLPHGTQTLPRF